MSKDEPDFTEAVKIYAWNGTELIPVLVDAAGRIMMIPYGATTVEGSVDVTQINSIREIQGKDGITLRTMAVDNSGNIIAVIKGEYGGILKTIATNEQGYMLIKQLPLLTIDRKGDVTFVDDLSNGLGAGYVDTTGAGARAEISGKYFKNGGFSLALISGSDDTKTARVQYRLPYHGLTKTGVEFNISFDNTVEYIKFLLYCYTSTHKLCAEINLWIDLDKLSYVDSGYIHQDFATSLNLSSSLYLFNSLKFVVDFENEKYVRVIFNGISYDLSSYAIYKTIDTTSPHLWAYVRSYSLGAVNGNAYLDSIIITRDEP